MAHDPKIAILIPCYNEEKTVAFVVRAFRERLPDADIYVFDNNSTDKTAEEAGKAGAIVGREKRRGKGFVIRSMFSQVEADVYVMVDGDGTYPAERVHELIEPVASGAADMVVGSRLHSLSKSRFKALNKLGNRLYLFILKFIFRVDITDLLSGYRAMSRRVVKTLPLLSRGFEIETELTMKSLERGYRVLEVPIDLSPRPEGSASKIHIFRDGVLILNTIFSLFRDYKPLTAFGLVGLFFIACGAVPGFIVVREFILTGAVYRVPSAVLAVGLVLSGLLIAFTGLVLHSLSRRFQEIEKQVQGIAESVLKTDSDDMPSKK